MKKALKKKEAKIRQIPSCKREREKKEKKSRPKNRL